MTRLSPEREKEISRRRIQKEGESHTYSDIQELLAELTALRADMACRGVHTCHDECRHPMCLLRKENEALRAINEHQQINFANIRIERDQWKWEYENLCKFATDYEQQRDRLKERLWKLRDAIAAAIEELSSEDGICVDLSKALAADDEMEGKCPS